MAKPVFCLAFSFIAVTNESLGGRDVKFCMAVDHKHT
jgi:hypothetical protein